MPNNPNVWNDRPWGAGGNSMNQDYSNSLDLDPFANYAIMRAMMGDPIANTDPNAPFDVRRNNATIAGQQQGWVYIPGMGQIPMSRAAAESRGLTWTSSGGLQASVSSGAAPGSGPGGPAATNAATTTAAATPEAAAMSWTDAAGLALGAYQAYEGYQNARNGAGPWTQGVTPYGNTGQHLQGFVDDAMAEYQRRQGMQMPDFFRGGGGGGGGASSSSAGPSGMSYMQDLMGQAMGRTGGSGALNAGMGMLEDRLGGGSFNPYAGAVQDAAMGFQNPYQNATFGAAQQMQQGGTNPYVDQFLQSLGLGVSNAERGGAAGGTGQGALGSGAIHYGGGGGGRPGGGGGGGGTGYSDNLFNPYLKAVLDGKFMDGNPYLEDQIAAMGRDLEAQYRDGVIPGIGDAAERAGMLSSSVYGLGLGAADAAYSQNLADAISGMRFQGYETGVGTYMDALGLGNQLQLGKMQTDAQRDMANASSSAAAASNAAALDAQQRMHAQQMALGALNLYSGDQQFGLGQMGNMAGMFGDQQLGALGLAGQMALGRGEQDLGALGLLPGMEEASWLGITNPWQMATGMQGMQNQQQQAAAAAANQRAQQQQQRWLWNYGQGMGNIQDALGVVGGIGLDFGTRYGTGSGGGQSPTQAAIAGFIGGNAQGRGLADMWGG